MIRPPTPPTPPHPPPGTLVGREGDRFAFQLAQRVTGGPLLGFLFVAAPGGLVAMGADLSRDLEALAVVRPLFIEQLIRRRGVVLALNGVLQQRLELVPWSLPAARSISGPMCRWMNSCARGVPAIQVDGGHE